MKIKKLLNYLLFRRLAIDALQYLKGTRHFLPDKKIFQWQKMPPGYRWF